MNDADRQALVVAIVAYHVRLEKAGIKASGQQMKLSRLQTADEFQLLEADCSEGEAELLRRMTLAGRFCHLHPHLQPQCGEVQAAGQQAGHLQAPRPARGVGVYPLR